MSLCDYSSFAKMDLWSAGDEVVKFLQRMCSNDIDVPVGHIVITGMQNKWGGYENDCSIARLAENRSDISLFHKTNKTKQNYFLFTRFPRPRSLAFSIMSAWRLSEARVGTWCEGNTS